MLELVNRARQDPAAEAARLGVDLTADLTAGELAHLGPQEPLALNAALTMAARLHSVNMAENGFFDHIDPEGLNPTDRAVAQGYYYSAGENIAAGYESIDAAHLAWLESVDHRKNVLSLWESFNADFHYDEFGFGIATPSLPGGPYSIYYSQEFGYQGGSPEIYALGVVYNDIDGNSFYGIGEGAAGIRIDVLNAASVAVGTYTTDAAGNYQIAVASGTYTLRFTNLATGLIKDAPLTISDVNVKIDARTDELINQPPPPPDNGGGNNGGNNGGNSGGNNGGNTGGNNGGNSGGNNGGNPPAAGAVGPGAAVGGSANGADVLTLAAVNSAGHAIVFRSVGVDTWTLTDLSTINGLPAISGELVSWTGPTDGITYAAGRSSSGLILFKLESGGGWSFSNLTTSITGAAAITDGLTQFTDVDNTVHLAGLDAGGELVMYTQNGSSWVFKNISKQDLAANGQQTPAFTSGLISYVTSWNGMNIAGLDASGQIQVVWWSPSLPAWRTDNLSAITGAPAFNGGITAYLTPWGGINLAGVTASGHLSVTWWVPGFGGDWLTNDLSEQFSGPAMNGASISSYVTPWGGLNVAGLDNTGKLVVYWWAPGLENWAITPLSDGVVNAKLPTGAIRGITSAAGTISLVGADGAGSVLRYWWAPGRAWEMQDLTALTA